MEVFAEVEAKVTCNTKFRLGGSHDGEWTASDAEMVFGDDVYLVGSSGVIPRLNQRRTILSVRSATRQVEPEENLTCPSEIVYGAFRQVQVVASGVNFSDRSVLHFGTVGVQVITQIKAKIPPATTGALFAVMAGFDGRLWTPLSDSVGYVLELENFTKSSIDKLPSAGGQRPFIRIGQYCEAGDTIQVRATLTAIERMTPIDFLMVTGGVAGIGVGQGRYLSTFTDQGDPVYLPCDAQASSVGSDAR